MTKLTETKPTLTLCIPVYKGRRYWEECWASVKPLVSKFDKILVSINYSEYQPQDLAVIQTDKPDHLQYILQPKLLSPVNHGLSFYQHLDTDYVFFLCHDDWLLKDGLEEVLTILKEHSGQNIAIFGSHEWTETESMYSGISRELIGYPEGIEFSDFVLYDVDKFLAFNASGLVTPVQILKRSRAMMKMFAEGFRADNFIVTYPGIEKVFQTFQPSVRIRLHAEQAGASPNLKNRAIDNTTYYFVQALYSSDPFFTYRSVEQVMLCPLRYRQPYPLWYILKLLAVSIRWKGPKRYGLVAGSIFQVIWGAFLYRLLNRGIYTQLKKSKSYLQN